jgi:hypothetical protein
MTGGGWVVGGELLLACAAVGRTLEYLGSALTVGVAIPAFGGGAALGVPGVVLALAVCFTAGAFTEGAAVEARSVDHRRAPRSLPYPWAMRRFLVKASVPDWQFDLLVRGLEGEGWVVGHAGDVRTIECHDTAIDWVLSRLAASGVETVA